MLKRKTRKPQAKNRRGNFGARLPYGGGALGLAKAIVWGKPKP